MHTRKCIDPPCPFFLPQRPKLADSISSCTAHASIPRTAGPTCPSQGFVREVSPVFASLGFSSGPPRSSFPRPGVPLSRFSSTLLYPPHPLHFPLSDSLFLHHQMACNFPSPMCSLSTTLIPPSCILTSVSLPSDPNIAFSFRYPMLH